MVTRDEFLEYAHVYSHWYGTPRGPLMDKIEQGVDVLLEIDVQGALQIKKQFVDAVFELTSAWPACDASMLKRDGRGQGGQLGDVARYAGTLQDLVSRFSV